MDAQTVPIAVWPVIAEFGTTTTLRILSFTEVAMQNITSQTFLQRVLDTADITLALNYYPPAARLNRLLEAAARVHAFNFREQHVYENACRLQLLLTHQRRILPRGTFLTVAKVLGLCIEGSVHRVDAAAVCWFFLKRQNGTRDLADALEACCDWDVSDLLRVLRICWTDNLDVWLTFNIQTLIEVLTNLVGGTRGDLGILWILLERFAQTRAHRTNA